MKNKASAKPYIYRTHGVCPPEIHFKICDGKIKDLRFVGGGCPGNAQLVSRLLEDKSLSDVLDYIEGIECRNNTSCSAELARAIQVAQNGTLKSVESFKVQKVNNPRRSVALIGNLGGHNEFLELILEQIQHHDVDTILYLGDFIGKSTFNQNLLNTIKRENIFAIQGENDWHYSLNFDESNLPRIEPQLKDWIFRLPQVLSFKLNNKKSMAFFGDYIQSMADYSDFEPFALEMNMVCGLTNFMRDENVFPALEAMIPQFQADIIIFSQTKSWGYWHVKGKDFISVGAPMIESEITWGLLSDNNGRAIFEIMKVES